MDKILIGAYGELLASKWLGNRGFTIIDRNYVNGKLEADILAAKDGVLHIVEVKTRTLDSGFPMEGAVSRTKLKNMRFMASRILGADERFNVYKDVSVDVLLVGIEYIQSVV